MNVLLLTPDRVGSTLLQRVLTVFMNARGFDKPVINLHELTNGLDLVDSAALSQLVVRKNFDIGYSQSLLDIERTLSAADHYKTSRLAHYHLERRQDSVADRLKFYDYLSKNFYIIGCRRGNLFEHALSWVIESHSKCLNVYNVVDKVNMFQHIYNSKITITREAFENSLTKYKKYIEWSDTYFNVQTYFNYDTDVHDIESFISNLSFMQNSKNIWTNKFGQPFDEFNACHKLLPDLLLRKSIDQDLILDYHADKIQYDKFKGDSWPEYIDLTPDTLRNSAAGTEIAHIMHNNNISCRESVNSTVTPAHLAKFLGRALSKYKSTVEFLDQQVADGLLVSPIPIKLQTLAEKKELFTNFEESIGWYNSWVDKHQHGSKYSIDSLRIAESNETNQLNARFNSRLSG